MRRDPTEFRERFKKWKTGEKVYKNGLPFYALGNEPWGDTEQQTAIEDWGKDWKMRTERTSPKRQKVDVNNSKSGNYSAKQLSKNTGVHKKWDPTSGADIIGYIGNIFLGGNLASGEEDQYWRAYLGLKNKVLPMNSNDVTPWDSIVEARKLKNKDLPSDFYGGTDRMKYFTEAIADTLNTGRLVRKGASAYAGIYNTGKKILLHPYKYHLVVGNDVEDAFSVLDGDDGRNEWNPLGMLKDFGLMWDPKKQRLYAHDTYDFPEYVYKLTNIPRRPSEMKIRYSVPFSPYIGSEYFNLLGANIPPSLVQPFTSQNKYKVYFEK